MIVVAKKTEDEMVELCSYIKRQGYSSIILKSLELLDELLIQHCPMAIFIDIDSILIDNRLLRRLHENSPQSLLLLISARKAHPDLREAIGEYVYACISKPLDTDEIDFWLKSIQDDSS